MVIAFTEEQKKEIEKNGITVIAVKSYLYKVEKTIQDISKKLKEIIGKVKYAFSIFAHRLLEATEEIRLALNQIYEKCHWPTSPRYRIVKTFSKCTGTDIRFGWKCTRALKRWLPRSCC